MYNILEFVKDLNIPMDETRRLNCPVCNSYKTFTATNNMGSLVWNCYKISCSLSGTARVRLSVDDIKSVSARKEVTTDDTFEMPEYIVPHNNRNNLVSFCERWKLDADELNLQYDVKDDRVVFPIEHNGKLVDATGRSLGKRIPKWKRYGNNPLPYTYGCGKVALVVEDCVSACVSNSNIHTGVAILGTSLSEDHKKYLSQFSTAIVALDPDALPKILQFARELRAYTPDVRVLRLKDDLKYRNEEDIYNLYKLTPKE
tara:strand:- start:1027 stop:1800 length:774 start_codon:yes stop_codon:yes gene_type:complete